MTSAITHSLSASRAAGAGERLPKPRGRSAYHGHGGRGRAARACRPWSACRTRARAPSTPAPSRGRASSSSCGFPNEDPLTGTLAAFGTYFIGFASRPIGAAIFGHYGDRIGRKGTLIHAAVH